MAIMIGNKSPAAIQLGTQTVSAVYLGSKLIWPEKCVVTLNFTSIQVYGASGCPNGTCLNEGLLYDIEVYSGDTIKGYQFGVGNYTIEINRGDSVTITPVGQSTWNTISCSSSSSDEVYWDFDRADYTIPYDTTITVTPYCYHYEGPYNLTVSVDLSSLHGAYFDPAKLYISYSDGTTDIIYLPDEGTYDYDTSTYWYLDTNDKYQNISSVSAEVHYLYYGPTEPEPVTEYFELVCLDNTYGGPGVGTSIYYTNQ
jgi:hypothetical protein